MLYKLTVLTDIYLYESYFISQSKKMRLLDLKLRDLITSNFLYYSWVNLKSKKGNSFDLREINCNEPLSKYWFSKASLLIRNGVYDYGINYKSNFSSLYSFDKKVFLRKLKNKVIENAFLLILEPYFFNKSNSFSKNMNLTECLRMSINNLFGGSYSLLKTILHCQNLKLFSI